MYVLDQCLSDLTAVDIARLEAKIILILAQDHVLALRFRAQLGEQDLQTFDRMIAGIRGQLGTIK